jgi:hypothetical protein
MITITLKNSLRADQEQWLSKNVGPRLHYLHNSIGGVGWIAKKGYEEVDYTNMQGNESKMRVTVWNLTFQEDKYATWFRILFPE